MAPIISLLLIGLVGTTLAHPGHDVAEEARERAEFLKRSPKSVRSCATKLKARGFLDAAIARRKAAIQSARSKRSIEANAPLFRRSFEEWNFSHESNKSVTWNSSDSSIFSDNSSCVLQPEVTQGPYYIDGELIRQDLVEAQQGVPLYLDIQLIDTSDCSPANDVYMDIWHCNSTGVYGGVVASGNGNENDTSNLDNTWLRGIQPTDDDGVAKFETIFPGHYTGRATHIHVLTHTVNDTTVLSNNTLATHNFSTAASHVGQIYFDQSLISQVEALTPYNTNTQNLTLNSADSILAQGSNGSDPFVEYVLLGSDISDGIFAWISLGIDPETDTATSSAGTHYADGDVTNENQNLFGGAGLPSGISSSTGSSTSSATSTASIASSTGAALPNTETVVGSLTFFSTALGAIFALL